MTTKNKELPWLSRFVKDIFTNASRRRAAEEFHALLHADPQNDFERDLISRQRPATVRRLGLSTAQQMEDDHIAQGLHSY